MSEDEPVVEVIGLYNVQGVQYKRDEIEVPPLCQTCVQRSAEGLAGVLCQLSWLDRMLTPEDAREQFSCHAYKRNDTSPGSMNLGPGIFRPERRAQARAQERTTTPGPHHSTFGRSNGK